MRPRFIIGGKTSVTTRDSLLEFPCELPIKVLGRNLPGFRARVLAIVRDHYRDLEEHRVTEQKSRRGAYLSLTITVPAASREEVDAVYRALTANAEILVVL